MSFIELTRVEKSYGKNLILDSIDLTIERGEFVTIIGPYGSGKSTILRHLAGLLTPDSGTITINGASPSEALKSRKIGYAFQNANILPWKTVAENITMVQDIANVSDAKKVRGLLRLGNLEEHSTHNVQQLSGGMQQILGILRALTLEPDLLILDEPFASIDEVSREKFQKTLKNIHAKTKKTTLMVTHSIQEAVYLSDRIVVLTKKPAKVNHVVTIKLAEREDMYSKNFNARVKQLRMALADD